MNIHIFNIRKTPYPTGIERCGLQIAKSLKEINLLKVNEGCICLTRIQQNLPKVIQKFILLYKFLFYCYHKKKFNMTSVFLSVSTRLPPFLPDKLIKVVILHDLVFKKHPKSMSLLGYIADYFLVPSSLRRSDLILSVSQSTANDLKLFYPEFSDKVQVISLSSTLSLKETTSEKSLYYNKYILSVGTIEPRKNHIRLINAYSQLPLSTRTLCHLVIVGNKGWGNIDIQRMINILNMEKYIIFKSYVNDSELINLYKHAHCLIMPSLYEGFGLPIIEAQNFSIPVITSRSSSMPEIAGDGALFIDPYSIKSIKNTIELIVKDESLRRSLSKKAKKNASKYSWQKTAKLISDALFSAVEKRK